MVTLGVKIKHKGHTFEYHYRRESRHMLILCNKIKLNYKKKHEYTNSENKNGKNYGQVI